MPVPDSRFFVPVPVPVPVPEKKLSLWVEFLNGSKIWIIGHEHGHEKIFNPIYKKGYFVYVPALRH